MEGRNERNGRHDDHRRTFAGQFDVRACRSTQSPNGTDIRIGYRRDLRGKQLAYVHEEYSPERTQNKSHAHEYRELYVPHSGFLDILVISHKYQYRYECSTRNQGEDRVEPSLDSTDDQAAIDSSPDLRESDCNLIGIDVQTDPIEIEDGPIVYELYSNVDDPTCVGNRPQRFVFEEVVHGEGALCRSIVLQSFLYLFLLQFGTIVCFCNTVENC